MPTAMIITAQKLSAQNTAEWLHTLLCDPVQLVSGQRCSIALGVCVSRSVQQTNSSSTNKQANGQT